MCVCIYAWVRVYVCVCVRPHRWMRDRRHIRKARDIDPRSRSPTMKFVTVQFRRSDVVLGERASEPNAFTSSDTRAQRRLVMQRSLRTRSNRLPRNLLKILPTGVACNRFIRRFASAGGSLFLLRQSQSSRLPFYLPLRLFHTVRRDNERGRSFIFGRL